jgi:uncharacterized protein (TIGR03435 family)
MKLVLTLAVCAPILLAQDVFETASIKPSPPIEECSNGSIIQPMTGGGLRTECVSLKGLLVWAYQVQNYQVLGGPAWLESVRWNIMAKAAPANGAEAIEYEKMTDQQRMQTSALVRRRVQSLLAERCLLALRRETREQPVYTLTVARNGHKLTASADQAKSGFMSRRSGRITSRGSGLDLFAQYLGVDLGRPVINRTGLAEHYDFQLEWTPDRSAATPDATEAGPTIFTAIQEQLGLKLEPAKGPVEMLIIERAEKPADQ